MTSQRKMVGDYVITSRLGSGSFAQVFKAHHVHRPMDIVAIKAISLSKLNRKLRKNLEAEISIMRHHQHPNIVKLFAVEQSENHIYLVLEYCAGGDLHKFIRKHKRLEEKDARFLLCQLSAGVQFLWSHNLVHRDLKPHNLLLTKDSRNAVLKIADFGFARYLCETSMAETLCGSPLYMAPEILKLQKYDAKADLWSVGTILFELLIGKPPFQGANQIQLLKNIESQELRVPKSVRVSATACELLHSLLQRNPMMRISFEEFFSHPFIAGDVNNKIFQGGKALQDFNRQTAVHMVASEPRRSVDFSETKCAKAVDSRITAKSSLSKDYSSPTDYSESAQKEKFLKFQKSVKKKVFVDSDAELARQLQEEERLIAEDNEGRLNSSQGLLGLLPDASKPLTGHAVAMMSPNMNDENKYMRAHAYQNHEVVNTSGSVMSTESHSDSILKKSNEVINSDSITSSFDKQMTLGPQVPLGASVFGMQDVPKCSQTPLPIISTNQMLHSPQHFTKNISPFQKDHQISSQDAHHIACKQTKATPRDNFGEGNGSQIYGVHTVVFEGNKPLDRSVNGEDYVLVHTNPHLQASVIHHNISEASGSTKGHHPQQHLKKHTVLHQNQLPLYRNTIDNSVYHNNVYQEGQYHPQGHVQNQQSELLQYNDQEQFKQEQQLKYYVKQLRPFKSIHMPPVSSKLERMAPLESAARRAAAMAKLADLQHVNDPDNNGATDEALSNALVLYVKALKLLHSAGEMANALRDNLKLEQMHVEEHEMLLNALSEIVKFLKVRFLDIRDRAKICRGLIRVTEGPQAETQGAESIVWLAAVDKCKQAAAQELLGEKSLSRDAYLQALVLLETLLLGDEVGGRDRVVVQEFGEVLTKCLTGLTSLKMQGQP